MRLVDSVERACGMGWDTLVHPDDLFHWSGWLSMEHERSNLPPFYLLTGEGDEPAPAALSCYPLDASSEPWPFMRVDRTLRHLVVRHSLAIDERTAAAIDSLLPTLACGGRRAPDTRVLTAGLPERRPGLVEELVAAAEREAAGRRVTSVSFLFVGEADHAVRCALTERGYLEFPSANYATLRLPGSSFQDYADTLSRVRRRQVLRERRRLRDAGLRFVVEPLTHDLIDQLVPLMLEHGRKYGHAVSPGAQAHGLGLFLRHCGPAARVISARSPDGAVRGFVLVVERGRRLFALLTAFDYGWQGRLPLYFGVCFYEPIEYACRIGASGLEYAIESDEAKRSRGCELEQRYGYLKVLDADTHRALQPLLGRIRTAAATGAVEAVLR
jgi:hypothetical protein